MKKPRRAFIGRENPIQTFEIKTAYVSVLRELLLLVDTQMRKWVTTRDKSLSKLVGCIPVKNSRIIHIRTYAHETKSIVVVVLATMYGTQLQIAVRYYRTSKMPSDHISMHDVITSTTAMTEYVPAETTMSPELLQLLKQSRKISTCTDTRMLMLSKIVVESTSTLKKGWCRDRVGPIYFIVDQPDIPW